MDYGTKFQSKIQFSVQELKEFYTDFENEFTIFFEELQNYVYKNYVLLKIYQK